MPEQSANNLSHKSVYIMVNTMLYFDNSYDHSDDVVHFCMRVQ